MWVFTTIGFFSVVSSGSDSVMVRARDKAHLKALVSKYLNSNPEIIETPGSDYRFRIIVQRSDWIAVMLAVANDVDYPNFKNAVQRAQGRSDYVNALHDVWQTMYQIQVLRTKEQDT